MTEEPKPIVLKDELAKMLRAANPAAWLEDAAPAVQEWAKAMPGAKMRGLDVRFRPANKAMDLVDLDFAVTQEPFCLYVIPANGRHLEFRSPKTGRPQRLATEQEFLQHLLDELSAALKT